MSSIATIFLPAQKRCFFWIILFKFFNKIETWEAIEAEVGAVTFKDYAFKRYDRILKRAMENGIAIYSAAYIMPSGGPRSATIVSTETTFHSSSG